MCEIDVSSWAGSWRVCSLSRSVMRAKLDKDKARFQEIKGKTIGLNLKHFRITLELEYNDVVKKNEYCITKN